MEASDRNQLVVVLAYGLLDWPGASTSSTPAAAVEHSGATTSSGTLLLVALAQSTEKALRLGVLRLAAAVRRSESKTSSKALLVASGANGPCCRAILSSSGF